MQSQSQIRTCHHCQKAIMSGSRRDLDGVSFHNDCFVCSVCLQPFGIEKFYSSKGHKLVCAKCYALKKCSVCNLEIREGSIMEFDNQACHKRCFVCVNCDTQLQKRFFMIGKHFYCAECIKKAKDRSCPSCGRIIENERSIQRGEEFYHPFCLSKSDPDLKESYLRELCRLYPNVGYDRISQLWENHDLREFVLIVKALQELDAISSPSAVPSPPPPVPKVMTTPVISTPPPETSLLTPKSNSLPSDNESGKTPKPNTISALAPPAKGARDPLYNSLRSSAIFDTMISLNLWNIQWEDAMSYTKSECGSTGVMFVKFPDSNAVVLKASKTIVAESFAAFLARQQNISAPHVRVLCKGQEEYDRLVNSLAALAAKKNEVAVQEIKRLLDKPFLLLMQFVAGTTLDSLPPEKAKELFSGPEGFQRMKDIGKILSVDLVTNNYDRLPLVWQNDGNLGNIMIQTESTKRPGKVVGIDFSLVCIRRHLANGQPNPQFQSYLNRVNKLLGGLAKEHEIRQATLSKHQSTVFVQHLKATKEAFEAFLGYAITDENCEAMKLGLLEGCVQFSLLGREQLLFLKRQVETMAVGHSEAAKEIWQKQLDEVDIEFLESVLNLFREKATQMEKAVTVMRKIFGVEGSESQSTPELPSVSPTTSISGLPPISASTAGSTPTTPTSSSSSLAPSGTVAALGAKVGGVDLGQVVFKKDGKKQEAKNEEIMHFPELDDEELVEADTGEKQKKLCVVS